jgi:hypothetical protein
MMKATQKNQSCCENIQQWVQARRKMMEGGVTKLCNTKRKTCATTKDNDDALK